MTIGPGCICRQANKQLLDQMYILNGVHAAPLHSSYQALAVSHSTFFFLDLQFSSTWLCRQRSQEIPPTCQTTMTRDPSTFTMLPSALMTMSTRKRQLRPIAPICIGWAKPKKLRFVPIPVPFCPGLTRHHTEELSLLVHLRLLHDSNGILGIFFEVKNANKNILVACWLTKPVN